MSPIFVTVFGNGPNETKTVEGKGFRLPLKRGTFVIKNCKGLEI